MSEKNEKLTPTSSASERSTGGYHPPAPPEYSSPLPLLLNIHRAGGFWSKDDVITQGECTDSDGICYYLRFPTTWDGSWKMKLLRGTSRDAPQIATLSRGSCCFKKNKVTVNLLEGEEFKTELSKQNRWKNGNHRFEGPYGGTFEWSCKSEFAGEMRLMEVESGREVACWKRCYKMKTDGSIKVNPEFSQMLDLIVATGLAMQHYQSEQRDNTIAAIS